MNPANLSNSSPQNTEEPDESNKRRKNNSPGELAWVSIVLLFFGVLIVLLFGASVSAKATIYLWMLTCLLSGAGVGFLFGIPKILQNNQIASANTASPAYQQQVNTNLTEISDWLTKIIVGLGLVSLTKISPHLYSIAKILAQGLTRSGSPDYMAFAFAYGTIISYVILGFGFGYISTRLYLAGRFSLADQQAIQNVTKQAEDAQGAANSALQKVTFALIKPKDVPNQLENPINELEELARKYVQVRSSMERGSTRTTEMTKIFKEMTTIATAVDLLDVGTFLRDPDIGKRLAGYAYLYTKPDNDFMEPLVDAIITDRTPFGQYWGIQALGKLIEQQPTGVMSPQVSRKLKTYYNGLTKGTDREYELRKILPAINK
jgi:hypothetical protein